jgi:lycopene beta-cyclase
MAFDIVIVGGGLSGLALAAELARPEFATLRVLVLEQRERYVRDRTWSYWQSPGQARHRYSHLERKQWQRWCVRQDLGGGRQSWPGVTQHGRAQHYCSLDGDQFYAAAQRTIAASSNVTLRLSSAVRQIVAGPTPSVETADREVIPGTWVFDARPPPHHNRSALVQQFYGCEITADQNVFDPSTVELMHFFPSTEGLHFFYILPYSARNALVETTWISPASLKPDFSAELRQFIKNSLGLATYDVVYEEQGVLSLGMHKDRSDKGAHVVPLGRGAGTLRPSTGYAFLDTLAHAQQIGTSLEQHLMTGALTTWVPPAFKRSALDTWMDKVFLRVLEHDWLHASGYFMQLFEHLDADTVVAFLSGRASWRQRLQVARVLPTQPFAMQALLTWADLKPTSLGAGR